MAHTSDPGDFRKRVLAWVTAIPKGSVATYGQIAALAGHPRAPRQVGMILRGLRAQSDVPWQRVINREGGLSTWRIGAGDLQQALLEAEGVCFDAEGHCDLVRYQWQPDYHTIQSHTNP
ncbi:MAG: MGMT family protein [Candidatus Sericytochromatia bacterium]